VKNTYIIHFFATLLLLFEIRKTYIPLGNEGIVIVVLPKMVASDAKTVFPAMSMIEK
jgi:hypothetical protein